MTLEKSSQNNIDENKISEEKKPTKIEELIPLIVNEINKRRKKWTLTSLSFDDVSQIVLIRIVNKYHTFDPTKGEFSHWVNRVISRTIINVLRDNYLKYSRPCILGCIHNTGDDHCSLTKSGRQCAECPLYRDWERFKKEQFNINQPVSLDNHLQEVDSEFFDIEHAQAKLNIEMKKRLRPSEWKIYKTIYVDRRKSDIKEDTIKSYGISYPTFSKMNKLFIETAKKIIEEESLV